MKIEWKPTPVFIGVALLSVACSACQSSYQPATPSPISPGSVAPSTGAAVPTTAGRTQGLAQQASSNGAAGQMPAYYDGQLFTVNMKEMPNDASASLIANNPSINEIYASNDLDEEQEFIPVIDAIQGEGFNPLWQQILIVFNAGFTPHQFVSEEQIDAAAAGANPEITLVRTDEMYRCSVVGKK